VSATFKRVSAGDLVPEDVAKFVCVDGVVRQPVFIGDVVLAIIGDNCWVLPASDPAGITRIYSAYPGFWDFQYNVVSVLQARTWTSPAGEAPASAAGIDISGGLSWGGPKSWPFSAGDEVPDWLVSYEPLDPGVEVTFHFEGDVEVVDLQYASWVLPRGAPAATTKINSRKVTPGRAKLFATRDLAWPVYVVVGLRDPGDGGQGPGPEPADPPPPVTPVLEPA
jgi:hypothetical protein